MDRLSGLDASFLYLETPEQLMHVCGLMLLDPTTIPGGYDFERLRDDLGDRVLEISTFMRKLRRVPLGLDFPVWEHDEHFDVQRHVHRMALLGQLVADRLGHLDGGARVGRISHQEALHAGPSFNEQTPASP